MYGPATTLCSWVEFRLRLKKKELLNEFRFTDSRSNEYHREDVERLLKDWRRGIALIEVACCRHDGASRFLAALWVPHLELATGYEEHSALGLTDGSFAGNLHSLIDSVWGQVRRISEALNRQLEDCARDACTEHS